MTQPTYPLALPTNIGIKSSRFSLEKRSAVNISPFSGSSQVYDYGFSLWKVSITLPPMKREKAAEWCAFFINLRGRFGTFLIGDPDASNPQGGAKDLSSTMSATAAVTAGLNVNDIPFDGLTGTGNAFKAGDYISVGTGSNTRLYMVREDIAMTSGAGTLVVEPSVRVNIADNDVITYKSCKGVFRMDSDELGWDTDHVSKYGITFSATEAI